MGECAPKNIKHRHWIGMGFGVLPDITNLILVHPYLGHIAGRTIPFALGSDFVDFPQILDHWTYHVWLLSHSLLFWAIVFAPLWRRSPGMKLATLAYLSHVLADLPSHTGAYGLEPFYPVHYIFDGWFDAWLWGPGPIAVSVVLTTVVFLLTRALRQRVLWPSERQDKTLNRA